MFAFAFALIGVAALVVTRAAVSTASFEAEAGTITGGGAAKVADSSASGGNAVKFASATVVGGQKCSQLTNIKFCDDFDGAAGGAPDSTKWSVLSTGSSWGAQCWKNTPNNISTDGTGNLKLTLIDTKTTQCTNSYGSASTVTSGGMDTKSYTTKFGKFEIRAKLACAKGVWGAIWLSTGTGPSWPQSGEIDIYEMGNDKQNSLKQTIHLGKSSSDKIQMTNEHPISSGRLCDAYHVYGVDWHQGYIDFTFDGVSTNRITEADAAAEQRKQGKTVMWPFDDYDQRILLDLQYGKAGTWTGTPNLAELPSSMLIDYIRVYN
ncbi:MAG TPA: glycoside hydrolase family 16 protein [Candidatus Saccharimonadales bacterium]|jgi:beta-glucanase (GH16 family)